jgi:hypothetical protein
MSDEKTMGQVIQIDEARIRDHLGEMVRGTVEETLMPCSMPKPIGCAPPVFISPNNPRIGERPQWIEHCWVASHQALYKPLWAAPRFDRTGSVA